MRRRAFLAVSMAAALSPLATSRNRTVSAQSQSPFKISLAEWSLNQTIRAKKLSNLDFPRVAREVYDIDCVELVDQFFANKAKDQAYLAELKKVAEDAGVSIGLLMLDTNGALAAGDDAQRAKAVEKTYPWLDAAAFLGCKTVRVNARGDGSPDEMRGRIVESCSTLADYAAGRNLNLVIENHGGPSSDPAWLVSVMQAVNKPNFGTLPDFGNFPDDVNRYDAVEAFMPYAKGVSAKSMAFAANGECAETDFRRMMRIVRDGSYTGYVGVESSPKGQENEADGILKTRDLLRAIFAEQEKVQPIFNGKDLDGWTAIGGGDWVVENGVLIGRNGKDWSTNPEKTGSWLRTNAQYADFRLELQYAINAGGNSGVFFRSAEAKNPAFTGYEMQIVDFAGQEPSKGGAGAIYDVVAPSKNLVRPAGQFNAVTIIAWGKQITIEMNGEKVVDAELDRVAKGYIGLQNHDDHSEVRFKNIRLQEL
ncbi:MAG TPA: family 16 glycoside hydrolase [Candidatus Bathyarchaeia archaeon]|nr:family 16 glycoside hydrolase [Candidatus Bathyarchaeia archaeon]